MLDRAGTGDVRHGERLARRDVDVGRDLPTPAQVLGGPRRAVPSADIPPLPFSPVKFSGLIERVFALDRFDRFPRLIPSPLNAIVSFP